MGVELYLACSFGNCLLKLALPDSLIIHKLKKQEIMAIPVFEYLLGFSIDLLQIYFFIFSVVKFRLRRHIKYSRQCLTTFPNASKFVKNTLLRVVFSTLFSVSGNIVYTVFCV